MKIFKAEQIKSADQFTIQHEPISSVDLMERAGIRLTERLLSTFVSAKSVTVFAGPGNNGGDGLVMARLLHEKSIKVKVYILGANTYSTEFKINLDRIQQTGIEFEYIRSKEDISKLNIDQDTLIIDALFGIGLDRPLEDLPASLVATLNSFSQHKLAIDIPSGLSANGDHLSSEKNTIVANTTFTIQFPKLSFFFPENTIYTGKWEIIDIGLSKDFIHTEKTDLFCLDDEMIRDIIQPRPTAGHKGTFGHALIVAGSKGKIGASILSGHAALRTGCGLLTMQVPASGVEAVHTSLPETMVVADSNVDYISDSIKDITKFNAIGFGPGIDKFAETSHVLKMLIQNASQPLVIDADGLNMLAENLTWLQFLNGVTIFTPHPGEFDRLTHKHSLGSERFKTQLEFSKKYGVYVVLKGHHTSITTPGGLVFFNTTGNDGMATGGSGDVLTGIITSLCAQGYSPLNASLLGVYLHGYAGDRAAEDESKTSLIASDIIEHIPTFFLTFEK